MRSIDADELISSLRDDLHPIEEIIREVLPDA